MDYISIIGIAIGLAMDAFAVSMAKGATIKNLRLVTALKIAFCFGLFQFFMPIIGWIIGKAGEGIINRVDHWIAIILLSYIGIKMIYDSLKDGVSNDQLETNNIDLKTLIILAIATSIDALATGIILPSAVGANTFILMLISTGIIGLLTFIICLMGSYIGRKFGSLLSSKAEIVGGLILIAMGIKIFIEHTI